MGAVYNEIDPFAAEWLKNLIAAGVLPAGEVDTRSISELKGADCGQTTHCFAGVGGWPLALRLAGWDDRRPVWTGSCPCQPFSAAGKRKGTADARHLWPDFCRLIRQRKPGVVLGEQVASKDGLLWLDGVFADLEASGYACWATDSCAAGVGSPHIRQRLFWVAIHKRRKRVKFAFDERSLRDVDAVREQGGLAVPESVRVAVANGTQLRGVSPAGQQPEHEQDAGDAFRLAVSDGQPGGQGRPVAGGSDCGGDAPARSGPGGDGEPGRMAVSGCARVRDSGPGKDVAEAGGAEGAGQERERLRSDTGYAGPSERLANAGPFASRQLCGPREGPRASAEQGAAEEMREPGRHRETGGIPNARSNGLERPVERLDGPGAASEPRGSADAHSGGSCGVGESDSDGSQQRGAASEANGHGSPTLAASGPWSAFLIIPCGDNKLRRISAQSGDEPLAHGIPSRNADARLGYLVAELVKLGHSPKAARRLVREARANRVGRLRGYGNAIIPLLAAEFIRTVMEVLE